MERSVNLEYISSRQSGNSARAVGLRVRPHAKFSGISRMDYSDYQFTQFDKMMLTMIKLNVENMPPEKRWLLTTSEIKKECVPTSVPTMQPTKNKTKTTTHTTSKMLPSTCASQSDHPGPLRKIVSRKQLSAITQVR